MHYYRCHCVDWGNGKWVTETSTNSSAGFEGKSHWQVDAKSRCPTYLRFDHTEEIHDEITSLVKVGIKKLLDFAKKTTASTISVMWDDETQRWYQGKSGHDRLQGTVPLNIFNYIVGLPVNNGDWAFGWNCGEVECIVQAYNLEKTM